VSVSNFLGVLSLLLAVYLTKSSICANLFICPFILLPFGVSTLFAWLGLAGENLENYLGLCMPRRGLQLMIALFDFSPLPHIVSIESIPPSLLVTLAKFRIDSFGELFAFLLGELIPFLRLIV